MELIRQLKNNMSTELWIELQVQRNIMRREVKEEMNRLIDRAITKMAANMEATYGHIITKALNKLTVEYKVHSDDSEDDSEDELPSEESSNNNNNKKQATEKNVNAANANAANANAANASASTSSSTTTPANASNGNANAANASASTTTTTPANAPNGNANAVTPTTKTNATFVVVNGTTGATPITTAATTPAQINRPIANCKTRIRVVAPNSGPRELINLEEGDDLGGDDDDLGEGDEEEDEEEEEDGGDENSMAVLSPVVTLVTADNNDEQFDDDGDDDDEAELPDAAMYDNSSVMKSAVVRANGLGGSGLGGSGGGQLQLLNHQQQQPQQQHQLQPLQRTLPGLYNRKRKIPKMTINTTTDSSNESSNYIRFGIRCPVADCEEICDFKAELDQHMLEKHGVNPYVCVLRGCSRSFPDITQLVVHQNNTHKALTTWPCKDCPKEAENCNRLTQHFYTAHYQRIYRCSLVEGAEGCDFIASTRREALRHFQMQHAAAFRQIKASRCQKAVFTCPYNGCGKVFSERTNLRTHKRFHSRSKPFGCSWPQCRYLSEDRANAIRHIRVRHLRLPATVKEQTEKGIVSDDDPRQWLQIYNEKF
ncbi:hypothetical protein TYRP_005764 [Tyrophagus putrescentiae]|nr:hypothetical protein TYRP_005764 [Tyrophagus putrescentiae]